MGTDLDAYADPRIQDVSFSSAASRAAAEAYIAEKFKYHGSIACYYKKSWNALQFTCRFPPEILSLIFKEVVTLHVLDLESSESGRRRLSWIQAVCHVCSHWRKVALRTPNLWANIPMESKEWAAEMVRRSRSTPLTLSYSCIRHPPKIWTTLKEVLSKESSRIQSLSVSLAAKMGSRLSDLDPFLHSAPLLEHLELQVAEDYREVQRSLILSSSPLLKHLSLKRCGLAWDAAASTFSNLQFLEISTPPRSTNLSIPQLLAVLSQAPLLEYLSVINGIADLAHPDQGLALRQTLTPVTLGLLKEISLDCNPCSSALLFDFLTFPGNIDLIRYSPMMFIGDQLEPFVTCLNRLGQRLGNAVDGMISQLMLGYSEVQCWMSLNSSKSTFSGVEATLQISPTDAYGHCSPSLRDAFWQSLPLDQLSTLIVAENTSLTTAMWSFFGDLPNLEDIRVTSNEVPLLKVLSRGIHKADADTAICPSFIGLQRLVLVKWQGDLYPDSEHYVDVARSLCECFDLRQAGLHLKLLELNSCRGFSEDDRKLLEKCVDKMIWIEDEDDWNSDDTGSQSWTDEE
ncbi:hypothetical protein H0H92_007742 [Tricholoma furcatifolium]|nr:hypothetical protein H0H92_007742 [Tricholoma furcatifolium]